MLQFWCLKVWERTHFMTHRLSHAFDQEDLSRFIVASQFWKLEARKEDRQWMRQIIESLILQSQSLRERHLCKSSKTIINHLRGKEVKVLQRLVSCCWIKFMMLLTNGKEHHYEDSPAPETTQLLRFVNCWSQKFKVKNGKLSRAHSTMPDRGHI